MARWPGDSVGAEFAAFRRMGSSVPRPVACAGGFEELASAVRVALGQPIFGYQQAGGQVGRQLPARLPVCCFVGPARSVADVELQRTGGRPTIEGDADQHVAARDVVEELEQEGVEGDALVDRRLEP